MCLWSPQVVPRSPNWDDRVRVAGYAYPPALELSDYKPPKALEAFLETHTGRPVFAFGFGSMTIPRPDRLLSAISGAVKQLGAVAVVILPGKPTRYCIDSTKHCSSSGLFVADEVPHGWLLPRCHGFIHHGGAGHTAAGLRSGVTMLLTPFFLDQNFWAARLRQLQLGPAPIPFRELTEDRLTAALREMLAAETGGKYRTRCLDLAEKISGDKDGAEVAAATVSQELRKTEDARCCLIPNLRADWRHEASGLSLSGCAAAALVARGVMEWSDARPHGLTIPEDSGSAENSSILGMISVILRFFWTFLTLSILLSRARGTEEGTAGAHGPISLALIRKGEFDLGLLRDSGSAQGNDIEARLVSDWRSVVGSRFRADFDQE